MGALAGSFVFAILNKDYKIDKKSAT
jgi:hypothetical protein